MNLVAINTGYFKLDGGAMFGVVPKTIWQDMNPADEDNLCSWAMRCLLIEDEDRLLLVDTGMGNKQSQKFFSYYKPHGEDNLIDSIKKAGYHPDNVTDVLLTHLHFDHCGAAVSMEGETLYPTFKNAIYHTTSRHWDYAVKPNAREKASFLEENMLPLLESGQLNFLDKGLYTLPDSVVVFEAHGHTEGMLCPIVMHEGKKLLFAADLIPSIWHVPPHYGMAYDMQPLRAIQEKTEVLKRAAAEKWFIFFEHDPVNEGAYVSINPANGKFIAEAASLVDFTA